MFGKRRRPSSSSRSSDIERSGATTIAEALRLVPGVQVARINTSGWAISVRGFNGALANKLLVLIDGREVYDPLFSGVYWDVQDTALEDIDRIEVIRGPGASLWGANAVNGVINIITKRAAETQGALVSAIAGEHRTRRAHRTLRRRERELALARLRQSVRTRPMETLAGGDANNEWQALRGGFRVDWEAGAGNSLTLQGDAYRSETGQFRSVPQLTAPYATLAAEDIEAEGANLLARWSRDYSDGGQLTLQAYVDYTARDQLPLKEERVTFDFDAQYNLAPIGAHRMIVGARYRRTSDDITQTAIITSTGNTHTEDLISAFFQDQITLTENLRLTLGSKFDANDYAGFEIQPNLRLQWADGETQMAWASVSRAVRTPSELEREFNIVTGVIPPGMIPAPVSVELEPNSDFDSEEVVAFELGYRRQFSEGIDLDLAVFRNDYVGLSAFVLQPFSIELGPPLYVRLPIQATNKTEADAWGAEALLSWRLREDIQLTASYSYLDLELHGPSAAVAIASEAAEDQSPRNQAYLRAQWDVNEQFTADATLYYVDELPGFQIDAYTRLDARVGWRLTDHLQFELVGQGLLDDQRREFNAPTDANATQIGRSIFGRLAWRS